MHSRQNTAIGPPEPAVTRLPPYFTPPKRLPPRAHRNIRLTEPPAPQQKATPQTTAATLSQNPAAPPTTGQKKDPKIN